MLELPVDPTATMRELDFRSLHQIYATWRSRVPAARPRRVHVSRELLANPARARYGDGLARVLLEIATGEDLRPRTSIAIEHAYTLGVPRLLARRPRHERHTDRLLADWGLHHLHLCSRPHRTRQGFVRRSPHVLFVAFLPNDAYLVDLALHESDGANWAALAILEVIVRNWPDSGVLLPSRYVTGRRMATGQTRTARSSGSLASPRARSRSTAACGSRACAVRDSPACRCGSRSAA